MGLGLSSWSPPCGGSTESTLSAACNRKSQTLDADAAAGKESPFRKSTLSPVYARSAGRG